VPAENPLRSLKTLMEPGPEKSRRVLDGLYSEIGQPSISPERRSKLPLLILLYSVRSDRLLGEILDCNILFRWLLDMNLREASFDASTFSKNRQRLASEEPALKFFDAVVRDTRRLALLSDQHVTVEGTLIEVWASMKSYQPKNGGGAGPDAGGDRSFKADRHSNGRHSSSIDPPARLLRNGPGKEAKLCFVRHALMDNRRGLMTDVILAPAVGVTRLEAALAMLTRQRRKNLRPKNVGADKVYHTCRFGDRSDREARCHHVASNATHAVGRGRGYLESRAYRANQIVPKSNEQFFAWGKTISGLRKTRLKGVRRNEQLLHLTGAANNSLPLSRLSAATG
jgi:transposase